MAFAMYEMFMRRMEKGLSEEELIQRSPNPRFTRAFRRGPQVLFVILGILIIVTNTLFTASSHGLFLAGIGTWGVLSAEVVLHPRLGARFSTTGKRLFIIVPLVVIWVGYIGYARGEGMLTNATAQWNIAVKAEQGTEKRQLLGLRRFSTATIAVAMDRRVFVLPSESIVSTELIRAADADSPRLCRWFGVACLAKKSVP